jgi:VWFA-related protein
MLFYPTALPSHPLSSSVLRVLPCSLVLLLIMAWALPGAAQETDEVDVVRVSTDLSVFPIRVRNRGRDLQVPLTESDFQLRDNDGITTSLYFAAGANRIAIIFALDESGSLRQILSQQRDAALSLFERFGQKSRVAVLRFSQQPTIVVPFGKDSEAARSAFDFRARSNTRTAIFDAAQSAVRMFENSNRDPAERRIVILISDGLDNASSAKASQIISEAQTRNVSFYTIQIPLFEPREGHLAVRGPSKGFKDLADKTGGKYFLTADASAALSPTRNQDLTSVFQAIEDDLRSQYVVGFYVGDKARDGRAHKVSIILKKPSAEYSVAQFGFSKTHHFAIKLPSSTTND